MNTPTARRTTTRRIPRRPDGRPLTLICYLCGREFGLSSLDIHIPRCVKKWKSQREQLPKSIARKMKLSSGPSLPIPETDSPHLLQDVEEYNAEAEQIFVSCTRVKCGCGRTFDPDRLVVHMRSCEKAQDELSETQKVAARPRMHMCYICGREYGSASLPIHQKKCLERRALEQSKLPKHLRTPPPAPPSQIRASPVRSAGMAQEDAMNDAAYESWKASLPACPNCGRTFVPESLKVHMRSCRKKQ